MAKKFPTVPVIAGIAGLLGLGYLFFATERNPRLQLATSNVNPGQEVGYTITGFDSSEPFIVRFGEVQVDEGVTNENGEYSNSFIVPLDSETGSNIVVINGEVNNVTHIIFVEGNGNGGEPDPEPEITPSNYPWGMTIQNMGSNMTFEVFEEGGDIKVHLLEDNIPEFDQNGLRERHYYLVRYFDPNGIHVKDYTNSLSHADPRDFDPSLGEIRDAMPGTWRIFVFVSTRSEGEDWIDDVSKPLEYSTYTAITEDVPAQFIGEYTVTV